MKTAGGGSFQFWSSLWILPFVFILPVQHGDSPAGAQKDSWVIWLLTPVESCGRPWVFLPKGIAGGKWCCSKPNLGNIEFALFWCILNRWAHPLFLFTATQLSLPHTRSWSSLWQHPGIFSLMKLFSWKVVCIQTSAKQRSHQKCPFGNFCT